MLRACIFAHYDKDDLVQEYVHYYLKELHNVAQKIVFVTVSTISNEDVEKLQRFNVEVVRRENIGYDFYSYKVGIAQLELDGYDELIICNDSVFGPIFPMKSIFKSMQNRVCDFWGITDSDLIAHHLQSYFLVFRKSVLNSTIFSDFWNGVDVLTDKNEIIKQYEVGVSQKLLGENFTLLAYVQYSINTKDNSIRFLKLLRQNPLKLFKLFIFPHRYFYAIINKKENASIFFWENLLLNNQLPFIKKSLVVNNNESINNMEKIKLIFQKKSLQLSYPIELIKKVFNANQ